MVQKLMRIAVLASNSHHRSARFELCGMRSGSVGVMSWFGHLSACYNLESPPIESLSWYTLSFTSGPWNRPLETLKYAPDSLCGVDNIDRPTDISF